VDLRPESGRIPPGHRRERVETRHGARQELGERHPRPLGQRVERDPGQDGDALTEEEGGRPVPHLPDPDE